MPAPITISDPATYYESRKTPSTAALVLGEDPVVPLRNLLATQNSTHPSSSGDHDHDNASSDEPIRRNSHHMDDISMSPRLLGYVFSCISSAVSMISSTIFLFKGMTIATRSSIQAYFESINISIKEENLDLISDRIEDMNRTYSLYFGSGGNLIHEWKVYGCIAVSGLLTLITLSTVIAHFDSFFCVKKNRILFQDGSKYERNLLLTLIVLSVCALYISTSKFSVGEAQANVFFSTWTNFIACIVNYEVWRKGSGRHLTFQNVLFGQKRLWFLLSIFTTICFLSTVDFFVNNNIIHDTHGFNCTDLSWTNQWLWFAFAAAVICWATVLFHRYFGDAFIVRVVEAIVLMAIIGVVGYIVASFAGGRLDQIPCPSNLYFSVWGAVSPSTGRTSIFFHSFIPLLKIYTLPFCVNHLCSVFFSSVDLEHSVTGVQKRDTRVQRIPRMTTIEGEIRYPSLIAVFGLRGARGGSRQIASLP